jgi:hypothetical protein
MLADQIIKKSSIKKYYGEKIVSGYPEDLINFEQSTLIKNVKILQSIWSYISFDIVLNNISMLEIVNLKLDSDQIKWLRKNIKVESFLNMINRYYEKVGCIETLNTVNDTFDQLKKLLNDGVEVTPPKRWRMVEFHDHISYLYLENTTQNNPIKTLISPYTSGEYTISQPKESLELVMWGKRVKNCVASYEERIGNSIWIFMVTKNGIPTFTAETDMSKKFNIKQIVSQCNGSVSSEDQSIVHQLILSATKR